MQTLVATAGFAYGTQIAAGLVFVPQQNERYFDLFGSIGFVSTTLFSLYFPALRTRYLLGQAVNFSAVFKTFHTRQLVMSALTALWAGRLGSFLFQRIRKHGKDGRFDEIKTKPLQFFGVWLFQGTWVALTALPVYAVNALGPMQPAFGALELVGLTAWAGAFLYEVVADRQKSAWREGQKNKEHDEKFITSGLWAQSRHPNYVGEVSMWAAMYLIGLRALQSPALPGWMPLAALASPLFEYGLIRYISGVPMLEEKAEKNYGKTKEWQEYKKNTPVFFPKIL